MPDGVIQGRPTAWLPDSTDAFWAAQPEYLAALGRAPEDIEAVAFSHLHPDHTGWATHERLFSCAAYLVAEPEWAAR